MSNEVSTPCDYFVIVVEDRNGSARNYNGSVKVRCWDLL